MEKEKSKEWIFITIAACPLLVLAFIWNRLPDQVPMHYNINGEIDDWGSKYEMLAVLGGMNLFMYFLFRFLPKIDPKKFLESQKSYGVVRMITSLFIAAISFFIIGSTITQSVSFISTGLPIVMCLLLIGLGNYFPVMKPNYFIGIRTPYTLENEEVWKKTHKVFGRIWFWGGLIMLPVSFFIPEPYNMFSIIGFILVTTVLAFILSYKWHKAEKA